MSETNPKFPRMIDFSRQQLFGTLPVINGGTGVPALIYSDTDASTITFDMSLSNCHIVTVAASRTFAVKNVAVGQRFMVYVIQGGSGSNIITWFTTIQWAGGGTAPTLTTTNGKADWLGFMLLPSGNYAGLVLGQNL